MLLMKNMYFVGAKWYCDILAMKRLACYIPIALQTMGLSWFRQVYV